MKKTDDELYSNFIAGETENFDELTIRYGDALPRRHVIEHFGPDKRQ